LSLFLCAKPAATDLIKFKISLRVYDLDDEKNY
jgi:hypothetical protein